MRVTMWAGAAALAFGMAGVAQAVPYEFTFYGDEMSYVWGPDVAPWFNGITEVRASVILDLPSIRSVDYEAEIFGFFFDEPIEYTESGGRLVAAWAGTNIAGIGAGWGDSLFGNIGISTDENGNLLAAGLTIATDGQDFYISNDLADFAQGGSTVAVTPGGWRIAPQETIPTPSPVPLPAGLPLLAAALGGLALLRRRS